MDRIRSNTVAYRTKKYRKTVRNWRYVCAWTPQLCQFIGSAIFLALGIYCMVTFLVHGGRSLIDTHVVISVLSYGAFLIASLRLRAVHDVQMMQAVSGLTGTTPRTADEARTTALAQLFGTEPNNFQAKAQELDACMQLLNTTRNPFVLKFSRPGERLWRFIFDPEGRQRVIACIACLTAAILFLGRNSDVTIPDVLLGFSPDPANLKGAYFNLVLMFGLLMAEIAISWDFLGLLMAEMDLQADDSANTRFVIRDLLRLHQLPSVPATWDADRQLEEHEGVETNVVSGQPGLTA